MAYVNKIIGYISWTRWSLHYVFYVLTLDVYHNNERGTNCAWWWSWQQRRTTPRIFGGSRLNLLNTCVWTNMAWHQVATIVFSRRWTYRPNFDVLIPQAAMSHRNQCVNCNSWNQWKRGKLTPSDTQSNPLNRLKKSLEFIIITSARRNP